MASDSAVTQNEIPVNGKGGIKKLTSALGHVGGPLDIAFAGVGAYMYHKEGDSYPVAIGKSLVTNAAWSLMPGGIPAMLGLTALQMAPEVGRAMDMKRADLNSKGSAFGGGFTQNAAQASMQQIGVQNIMQARQQANAVMSRHAQGAVKAY